MILAEQDVQLGGRLLCDDALIDGVPGLQWAETVAGDLAAMPEARVLPRTSAIGYFDHNALVLVEQFDSAAGGPRQRLWQVRAGKVILATGAIERPLVFEDNDRPGVMLASATRQYLQADGRPD